MKVSKTQKPPTPFWVWSWERSIDPFHRDAFPKGLEWAGTGGERKAGWDGLDSWGNVVTFVPDGTEFEDKEFQCMGCGSKPGDCECCEPFKEKKNENKNT